ncbi:MAG TPA: class I SAM-dependent methyltransferase [Kofleriaceae bacterium]|nr:class I SAM-dependent methyltransferase [Kofleriaceae bacterium]
MSEPTSSREDLTPDETLRGYDRWSASYDRQANPLIAATSWVLDHAPLGCAGADVVELGCGTGRNIARVLGEGCRSYTGVDGSPGMLRTTRARTADTRLDFVAADLLAPWQPARQFDVGLVVLVLEHLPTLHVFCGSLARAIKPGGRVRCVDLHPARIAAGSFAHFHEGGTEVRFASRAHAADEVARAFEVAGFDVVWRNGLADGELLAAVPSVAKHRGLELVLDVTASRRSG